MKKHSCDISCETFYWYFKWDFALLFHNLSKLDAWLQFLFREWLKKFFRSHFGLGGFLHTFQQASERIIFSNEAMSKSHEFWRIIRSNIIICRCILKGRSLVITPTHYCEGGTMHSTEIFFIQSIFADR